MALTRELNELVCRLGTCAELARSDAMRDLERSVYGCDYGGNGGTTRLGIVHQTTLPYSPYQNAKRESFWGRVEGRLMAMLEGEQTRPRKRG